MKRASHRARAYITEVMRVQAGVKSFEKMKLISLLARIKSQ